MRHESGETRYRAPLIAFLVANVVSICGTRVSAIAIPWFVLTTTGSPVKTGIVAWRRWARWCWSRRSAGR